MATEFLINLVFNFPVKVWTDSDESLVTYFLSNIRIHLHRYLYLNQFDPILVLDLAYTYTIPIQSLFPTFIIVSGERTGKRSGGRPPACSRDFKPTVARCLALLARTV